MKDNEEFWADAVDRLVRATDMGHAQARIAISKHGSEEAALTAWRKAKSKSPKVPR